jgi:photosystem II stability/assembly factor-like uncharacterized protein
LLIRPSAILFIVFLVLIFDAQSQNIGQWVEQQTEVPARGLMGISMADTGNGYVVGDVDVIFLQTGVFRKRSGDPMWRPVPPSAFSPPLNIALSSWAQDVHAIPNTGIAYISWRDDYRSLVYKTLNYGQSWFNISPINPILYGTRFAISFMDMREGMIVGEGPGRVHRTVDGGVVWQSHPVASNEPFTDVRISGNFWNIVAGQNAFFRYNRATNRWVDYSFPNAVEYFPKHAKLSFLDDDRVFLSGYNSASPNHILKSVDGGRNWNPIPQQPPFRTSPEGHKGIWFFDTHKGWAASDYDEFAYTSDGGYTWTAYTPQLIGGKSYRHLNKLLFLNEAVGWAVGGVQRTSGYPSLSDGWIYKWEGTMRPDISTTEQDVFFDTLSCGQWVDIDIPVVNSGSGTLTIPPGGLTLTHSEFQVVQPSLPISIQSGQSAIVTIRWAPPPGYYGPAPDGAALLVESNDDSNSPWSIALRGHRRIARLAYPAAFAFGTVCTGELSVGVLRVSRVGNHPPILLDMEIFSDRDDIQLVNHMVGDTLALEDSLVFHYRGERGGSFNGAITLYIGEAACPEQISIGFTGFYRSNALKPIPAILNFGDVCVGATSTLHLGLENTGTENGYIESITRVFGSPAFTLGADSGFVLEKGKQAAVPVLFTPIGVDTASTTTMFRIVSGPCADTVEVIVRGNGVASVLATSPDSLLRIGPVPLGIPASASFVIENLGGMPSTIEEIGLLTPVSGLTLQPPQLPMSVPALAKQPISMVWTPTSAGLHQSTVRIIATQPCPDTLTLLLELIADELPVIVTADDLVFDTQTCDEAVVDSIRITNVGQQDLLITEALLEGSNPAQFAVLHPQPPFSVPAGQHVYLTLSFYATSNGGASAFLRLKHNDRNAGGESLVRLNGRRTVRTLTIDGDTLSPLLACPGESVVRRLLLKNTTNEALQLLRVEQLAGAPDAFIKHPAVPSSIAPYDSVTLEIHAMVAADLPYDIVLRITTDPCFEQRRITFTAGPREAMLAMQPSPVDFGIRSRFDESEISVTLHNSDSAALVVQGLLLRDADGMTLKHSVQYPKYLAADAVMDVVVALDALKDTGTVIGSLCAILSAPCADTVCVDVSAIIRQGSVLASPESLRIVLAHCDSMACETVVVSNPLTVAQTVRASVMPVDVFTLQPDMEEFTLAAGASGAITVCARLDGREFSSGLLTLDGTDGYTTIPLTAQRDTAPLLLADTIDAGNIPYCEHARELAVPVENTGLLASRITDATFTTSDWSLLSSLPVLIPVAGSAELRFRFTPSVQGESPPSLLQLTVQTGDCEAQQTVQLIGRHATAFMETTPAAMVFANVALGSRQTRHLQLRNTDMPKLRVTELRIDDARFAAAITLPRTMDIGELVSIPVTFEPDMLGSVFASLCFIVDSPCHDTVCVSLEGMSVEGVLRFDRLSLSFDTLRQCENETRIVTVTNSSNAPVTLRGSMIDGPDRDAFILLDPIVGDEVLGQGDTRSFQVQFAPASVNDGEVHATLFISSDAPLQPVAELPLLGHRRTQLTAYRSELALGQVIQGALITRVLEVHNTASAAVILQRVAAPSAAAVDLSFPRTLAAGASIDMTVRYAAQQSGPFADTVRVYLAPCDGVIEVILTGTAVQRFLVSDLAFGQLPFCLTAEGLVTVRNNSAGTVHVNSIRIEGADATRFSIVDMPPTPFDMEGASQRLLTLRCTPEAADRGTLSAVLAVQVEIDGSVMEFLASLTAGIISGALDAARLVDAGAAPLGSLTPPVALVLRNTGVHPVRLEGRAMQTHRLRFDTATTGVVAPGDSLIFILRSIPDAPGVLYDTLILRYSEPCAVTDTIIIKSYGEGDVLPLRAEIGQYSAAPGDTLRIALQMDRSLDGFSVADWSAVISFNRSMLYPLGIEQEATISEHMTVLHSWDYQSGEVLLEATGPPAEGHTTLVYITCLVLIGNDVETELRLRSVNFAHPVLSVTELLPGSFTLDGYCLADGRRLLRERSAVWFGQSVPNPAHAMLTLPLRLTSEGQVTIRVYDTGGRAIAVVFDGILSGGSHELRFDASALPVGTYRLVLTSGSELHVRTVQIVR